MARLTNEKKAIINELATLVISAYGIEIPNDDIETIVKKIGGTIEESPSLGLYSDGMIEKVTPSASNEYNFVITVSSHQSNERRRFTIAHELGHLFLHMGYILPEKWNTITNETYYRIGSSIEEYEANEFAAALLMPADKFELVLHLNIMDDEWVNTESIARYFKVSEDAASMRGKWLGYIEW